MNREEKGICDLIKKSLDGFPLFDRYEFSAHLRDDGVCVSCATVSDTYDNYNGWMRFDLQVIDNICYILWVELAKQERGKGYGKFLFDAIGKFAKEYGCDRVRLTPSGWTSSGKPRLEYMKYLGYSEVSNIEVEKLV